MIYNPNELDIAAQRNDGSLELIIVSVGAMDDSAETQTLLLDKVENYLGYVHSKQFSKDFRGASVKDIRIVLKLVEEPPELIAELCKKIAVWVEENGCGFEVRIAK